MIMTWTPQLAHLSEIRFQTNIEIALDQIRAAYADGHQAAPC